MNSLPSPVVVAVGQALDELLGAAGPRRGDHAVGVRRRLRAPERDVLAGRQLVADEVLEEDRRCASAGWPASQPAAVDPVPGQRALRGLEELGEQLGQRRLARTRSRRRARRPRRARCARRRPPGPARRRPGSGSRRRAPPAPRTARPRPRAPGRSGSGSRPRKPSRSRRNSVDSNRLPMPVVSCWVRPASSRTEISAAPAWARLMRSSATSQISSPSAAAIASARTGRPAWPGGRGSGCGARGRAGSREVGVPALRQRVLEPEGAHLLGLDPPEHHLLQIGAQPAAGRLVDRELELRAARPARDQPGGDRPRDEDGQ